MQHSGTSLYQGGCGRRLPRLRGPLRDAPPGDQAQVDFAQFQVAFADGPGVTLIVWLFSLVLGYSRLLWARFVLHQDLQTVLRCISPPSPRSGACRARSSMIG